MKRAILLCVLILLYGYCRDARGEKPKMFPTGETLFIERNDELRINCYSKEVKLQFSFPETSVMIPQSDYEIFSPENGTYTFLRKHVFAGDAGWYACAKEGIEIDNDFRNLNHTHGDISWIYVYVELPDSESFTNVGVTGLPYLIIVAAGSTAVVPCRPTSASTYVKLWQNFKLVPIDGTAVKFDPKIGFIMKEVDFEDGEAVLQCEINKYNKEDYVLRLSGTKPTMITAGRELTIQEGNELRIECYSETKLSFLFPEMSNSSKYEFFVNKSGVNTFLRRRAVAEDTGWYGCAGEGIQNDISYYAIDYTKKEISWIYVYVNCTFCGPLLSRFKFPRELSESTREVLGKYPEAAIVDAEDPSATNELLIRMPGEDLQLHCEVVAPEVILFRAGWTVPSQVLGDRVQYNRTRVDGRFDNSVYLRGKTLTMTIQNISESDSGEYVCFAQSIEYWPHDFKLTEVSRHVEVFDKNGGRYIKLSKQRGALNVTGVQGTTVKWLMDLEDFPSAKISWCVSVLNFYRVGGYPTGVCGRPKSSTHMNTIVRRGFTTYMLFTMSHLDLFDNGVHRLSADIGDVTALDVYITIHVLGPLVISMKKFNKYSYKPGERVRAHCSSIGYPNPILSWSFLNCPKFPSQKDSNQMDLHTPDTLRSVAGVGSGLWTAAMTFSINTSGILTCEACNLLNCTMEETQIFYSATDEPYFTSTNLNCSEVTLSLDMDKNNTLLLECYVAGRPFPNVTWFKDNIPIQESRQFKLAYDNRELSIRYFFHWDHGRYMCRAENEYGKVESYVDIIIEGESNVLRSTLFAAAAVLLVISWVIIWKQWIKASRKKSIDLAFKNGALDRLIPELSVVDQAELLPYDMKWEFPRELLRLDKILGSGAFGIVKKAEAKSIRRGEAVTTVAVKLVRSKASLNYITALSRELKILVHLGKHINVVNLLGACTKNVSYGELFVIVEYCHFGNLHDYLLRGRADFIDQTCSRIEETSLSSVDTDGIHITDKSAIPYDRGLTEDRDEDTGSSSTSLIDENHIFGESSGDAHGLRSKYKGDYEDTNLEPISTRDLVYWSWQVSRGMDYLGKRKVVHGDLAARNILLANNGIVKISDFGLSKALYEEAQYRNPGEDPLPIRWMAIESIRDRVFSFQSDIWSFGIVVWEFFTLAKTPYLGIRSRELYRELMNGHRMEKPAYATYTIYDTMLNCWDSEPSKRPSFEKLAETLGNLLDDGFKSHYLEMSSPYVEMNAEMFDSGKQDYLTRSPTTFDTASSFTIHGQIEMENLPHDEPKNVV